MISLYQVGANGKICNRDMYNVTDKRRIPPYFVVGILCLPSSMTPSSDKGLVRYLCNAICFAMSERGCTGTRSWDTTERSGTEKIPRDRRRGREAGLETFVRTKCSQEAVFGCSKGLHRLRRGDPRYEEVRGTLQKNRFVKGGDFSVELGGGMGARRIMFAFVIRTL